MRAFSGLLLALWFISPLAAAQEVGDAKQAKVPSSGIEFTDLGIHLYGKFVFESEGELFDVMDKDSRILIPAGAVLTCIRPSYTIGYFAGGATITEGDKSRMVPKIFFTLKPSGEVTYHSPTPDGNFAGERLPVPTEFRSLYGPGNVPAGQGGAEPSAAPPGSKPDGAAKPKPADSRAVDSE